MNEPVEPDLELAREVSHSAAPTVTRNQIIKWAVVLVLALIGLYVVWPGLVEIFSAWPELVTLDVAWMGVALAAEVTSVVLGVLLVAEALPSHGSFFVVTTSQLASNALGRVVPGGAAGGALQFQMLSKGGIDPTRAVTGLATVNLLITAVPFALPLLAIPVVFGDGGIEPRLEQAAWLGLIAFVVLFALGIFLAATETPLRWAAALGQDVRNRVLRKREPMQGLPDKVIRERNLVRGTLGKRWWAALGTALGRSIFDYAALLACLAAVGAHPRPSLVLLAYVAGTVLALIPITPGGLGFVETGLVAMLKLAGVPGPEAVLAALTYRLISFWLPLPVGGVAYLLFSRRYERSRQAEQSG